MFVLAWLFLRGVIILRFVHVLHVLEVHSFLLLSSGTLYESTAVLSVHLLLDDCVIASFWVSHKYNGNKYSCQDFGHVLSFF